MAHIDDLMEKVDTKFHLVHLAAKRAREINAYYTQLGEGPAASSRRWSPPSPTSR